MRCLLLALATLAFVVPALAEERRYFKDWLTACRDDGYCSATAYVNPNPGGGAVADYILRIGRHAEQSYWAVSFTPVTVTADQSCEFIFSVDDQTTTFTPRADIGAYGAIK